MNNNQNLHERHSFAKGAMIITIGMLAVKFFGAIFKIPLMSILGGEGSAYFVGAYNLYSPIYALATAGLPIAISKIVSENVALGRFRDVRKIRRLSIPIFLITGSIGFVLIIFGSFIYSSLSKSPDSIYSILMLAPALLFSCLMSSYRGYYEGLRNMTPTATSEVIESIGKIVFGLSLAYLTIWLGSAEYQNRGTIFGISFQDQIKANGKILSLASAAAILGIAISAAVAFMYISMRYKIKGDNITREQLKMSARPRQSSEILKSIMKIALPVGMGAIIMNLAGVIDSILVQRRLADIVVKSSFKLTEIYGNFLPKDAVARNNIHLFLFGCFGFTSTIVMFLPTISQGLAISTLPSVTAAWTLKNRRQIKKSIEKILKLTAVISIPMGLGISALAYPIMDLIYNTAHSGQHLGEIYIGSQIMAISGIGAIFIALSTPVCSMLQAIGRADLPLKILSIGVIIKIVLNYILVGIPEINIQGAGIGTLVCYIFVFYFAVKNLCKNAKVKINFVSILVKPFISGLICALSALASHSMFCNIFPYKVSTILSIMFAAIIYLATTLIFRTITQEDLESTRGTQKVLRIFKKMKLM